MMSAQENDLHIWRLRGAILITSLSLVLGTWTLGFSSVLEFSHKTGYSGHNPHEITYSGSTSSPHHGTKSSSHGYAHHTSGGYSGSGHHPGAHQKADEFIEHILKFKEGMAITDEQEARLKEIERNFRKTRIKTKAEMELANLDLHEVLKQDNADLSTIESKLNNVFRLKTDLLMASIKAKREAKAVLTEEQRQRMKAVHERIKAHGSKMMKSGHGSSYSH